MWRRMLAYMLFGLGLLTVTFFRRYSGDIIPYPSIFWLTGLAMFLGGFLFLGLAPSPKQINVQKHLAETISDLMANGEKIQVDLAQCEIKEHSYIGGVDQYGQRSDLLALDVEREIQAWNALSSNSDSIDQQVEVCQTVIIFLASGIRNGTNEKFISRAIPKDKITLSFYLDKQKQTTLYVDRKDRARYYFDLDFLTT